MKPAGDAKFGYIHVPRGKTKNAIRNVSMTKRVKGILERRHKDAKEPTKGFVFAREDGEAIPYSTIDSQHDRCLADLSFKFRIYDFRHSFLTRLGEAGADAFS